jgi:hypothetical protein
MTRKTPAARIAFVAVFLALALALVPAALAGHGKPGGSGTSGSNSISLLMVNDANGNGLPNWGDIVTFTVSTTATNAPYVSVACSQNGTSVYGQSAGFFAGYLWPSQQYFTLSSSYWTSGAASCTARLYYSNGTKLATLATLSFTAQA